MTGPWLLQNIPPFLSSVSDSLADINHILRANHVWTPFTLLWNESVSRLLLSWSRWPFKNVDDQICGSFLLLSLLIITVALLLLLFDEFLCICHTHMHCCQIFCLLLDFSPDIVKSDVTCYSQVQFRHLSSMHKRPNYAKQFVSKWSM